jgi:hypothetical protein
MTPLQNDYSYYGPSYEKENRLDPVISFEELDNVAVAHKFKQLQNYHDFDANTDTATYIGFLAGNDVVAKISIYYERGIVGICVHRKKKRNGRLLAVLEQHMNLQECERLFRDPIRYLKKEGYAEAEGNKWKIVGHINKGQEEYDAITRWKYVNCVTGMCQNHDELDLVLNVISLYDELSFVSGSSRSSFSKEGRMQCGSKCCLETLLQKVARDYHGASGFYWAAMGEYFPLMLSLDVCPYAKNFLGQYGHLLDKLEQQFVALPSHLRNDLLLWLFGRGHCGSAFTDQNGLPMQFVTPGLLEAHQDYGRLISSAGKKKKDTMCWLHGIKMN